MFNIGDRVKCINNSPINNDHIHLIPRLKLNGEYIINNIMSCKCNSLFLDVGLIANANASIYTKCCYCSYIFIDNRIHWCASKRFVKIEEKKEYKIIHSEIIIEEPVLN